MVSVLAPWRGGAVQPGADDFSPSNRQLGLQNSRRRGQRRQIPLKSRTSSSHLCRAIAAETGPDLFLLDLAEKLEESVDQKLVNPALTALREASSEVAVTCRWPTSRDESYRFTDVKFLKQLHIQPAVEPRSGQGHSDLELVEQDSTIRLVFVDGMFSSRLSKVEDVPPEVYIGSIRDVPEELLQKYVLPRLSQASSLIDRDAFVSLNGIGAPDVGVVVVPEGFKMEKTIYVTYQSSEKGGENDGVDGAITMSNPRLLVVAGEGAGAHLVEEFSGAADACYWTNSVCEIAVEAGAEVCHDFVQTQGRSAVNMKKTYVSQGEKSSYKCVEVELGSRLSRHNLHIEQLGPDTRTEIKTFLLCGSEQLQDLHSRLVLNHPRGFARQLQKCIVIHSTGHGVFDGTIRVNRNAQQTDAGQLSRCLLLAPRATMNAKPSLQINADDVKCTHGVAISDLEEEQLFYLRARGIDVQAARSALVFSFGAEVIEELRCVSLRSRVELLLKTLLASHGAIQLTALTHD